MHTTPAPICFRAADRPSEEGDPAPYFRRAFPVHEGLLRAELVITALGVYEAYVNGVPVSDEVLAPGWTSYSHRIVARRHDVTALLAPGTNVLGAIVGEGWAVGALTWENNRHNYADRPALYARLELTYPGRIETVGSDAELLFGRGAILSSGIYAGETHDARAEPLGWAEPDFDDSNWKHADLMDRELSTVTVDDTPPIRRIEELAPISVMTSPSGRSIVDFGQNISGRLRITVDGPAGTTVTLRHAELLTPAGELETETLRSAAATDRYVLNGEGVETWEPRFTFHGFRYAEVTGWPGELTADALTAVVVHSDMTRTGWFATSDPLLTKLHENTVWSMRDNFVGVPTDCPQRDERLGWTGDLNAFTPTATYLYDVRGVLGSWLKDLSFEQAAAGTVPWTVPDVLSTASSATALWSDVAVSLPWALYQEYGDLDILRTAYPSMTAFIREAEAALDKDGLWGSGFQFGDWLDPDAPADNPAGGKTDRYLVACAYLCKTTREMAETARLLDERTDAQSFSALAERVRVAFQREFVTPTGRIASESATGYALTIMFGLLDEAQEKKAGAKLAELVAQSGFTISTGFAGTPLITDALSSTGHLDEAYELLLQTTCPSFLYPVTMGATTIWERWDSVLPDGTVNATGMTSLNHYALGAVADWMHRVIGGITRTAPGWQTMSISPQPGGMLTWAEASHDTVLGRVSSHWRAEAGEMVFDVVIPEGARATVIPPLHPHGMTVEVGSGAHSWRYPLPEGYGEEVPLSLLTPMKDVMKHDDVWQDVLNVMRAYFPGIPVEAAGNHMGELPLGMLADRLPQHADTMRDDLMTVLDKHQHRA